MYKQTLTSINIVSKMYINNTIENLLKKIFARTSMMEKKV